MITDLRFLDEFCNGDKERMNKYIGMYIKSTPENLEKIETAFNNQDYSVLKIVVHSMKPHLNFMGMTETRETAENIEAIIVSGEGLEDLTDLIRSFADDCRKSIHELS